MKMRNMAMAAALLAVLIMAGGLAADNKVSKPFTYEGYSQAEYGGVEKFSAYVPMSDGEKLAIDVYRPVDGPGNSFPVIIEYTPYTRAYIDVKNGPLHQSARKAFVKTKSPVLDLMAVPGGMGDQIKEMIKRGYVFVRADMRGCGASTGWKVDFMPKIGQDGGELVDWIATQPWCDGNVGMIGGSYSGYSQIVTAGWAGPALKAIAPVVVPLDGFDGEVYPGGVYLQGFMEAYSKRLGRLNLNYYDFNLAKVALGIGDMMLPAAPVIDEDGDGDLIDEVPLDLNRNGTFLDDYNWPEDPDDPPRYSDGGQRQHVFYNAIRDHRLNADYHFWAQGLMYIDSKLPAPMAEMNAYDFSPSSQIAKIRSKNIAIYNVGGWFDTFSRGTTEYFGTLQDSNPSRMLMHPGYHGGGGPFWKYLGEGEESPFLELLAPEMLRFFDHYLKGVDNGIDREPPVLIYVMNGEGWRTENEWPLARQQMTDFHFVSGQGLSPAAGSEGADRYRVDYSHDSRYGKSLGNRYLGAMGQHPDKLPIRTEKDQQCLSYTSAAMEKDLEVTGHPVVRFQASSNADYGDFFVYLEDVDEQGEAIMVTEGVLRAGFAALSDNDEMIGGGGSGIDVKPDLPWHGFERADYVDSIFKGGRVVELEFDLKPTSWVFRKGHSIRVTIAGSDWPTFRLHPRLCPGNDPKNPANITPTVTIHRQAARPSLIRLPVIPAKE